MKNGMQFIILGVILFFVCLETRAEQCNPADKSPCTIGIENTLPSGRKYNLEIIEAMLETRESDHDEPTGYWGANGAYPATYVKKLSLVLDESNFWVPVKAYSDLGNINTAEVKENDHGIVLIVRGGDAEGSYYATYVFINSRIRKRTVRASAVPDQLWEKTTFNENN